LNVTKCMKSIRDTPSLMLPIACPAELEVGSLHFASISGTSVSGDNVHLVLKHNSESRRQVILERKWTMVDSKRSSISKALNQALRNDQQEMPQENDLGAGNTCEEDAMIALLDVAKTTMTALEVAVECVMLGDVKQPSVDAVPSLRDPGSGWFQGEPHAITQQDGSPVVTDSLERIFNQEVWIARIAQEEKQDTSAASDVTPATQGNLLHIVAGNTCEKDAVKIQPPMLTKDEYSTTPPLCFLSAMDAEELRAITDFKIHRTNVGSLEWLVPVDLGGANLDCVDISSTGITVDKSQLPMLDCACQVVAKQVFPEPGATAKERIRFPRKLQARVESLGHSFKSYDAEHGVVRFQVDHFSRVFYTIPTHSTTISRVFHYSGESNQLGTQTIGGIRSEQRVK